MRQNNMQTETGNNQPEPEPDPPKLAMRKFQGVALLYDGRGINISGEAIDHITFLIRVTARLTEVPARVKELQIKGRDRACYHTWLDGDEAVKSPKVQSPNKVQL